MAMKIVQKDLEEVKDSLNVLSAELSTLTKQQSCIKDLLAELKDLKLRNVEQEKKIVLLENRVAELEQQSRMNDLIITGLKIKPSSFAQAVKGTGEDNEGNHDITTEEQVVSFLRSKHIDIDKSNIEVCHLLSSKNADKSVIPPVMIRLKNRKHKIDLLKQGRKLKDTHVYMNENLTKRNAGIARRARQLRKQGHIESTWTMNCKVFIKRKGAPENSRGQWIRDMKQLESLLA